MVGYLKQRLTNLIANIDPNGIPGEVGDKRFPILFIKEHAASHEMFELLVLDDQPKKFALKHQATERFVCLNGAGNWESREAVGGDEKLIVTIQPDGIMFVYRRDEFGQLLDVVEFVEVE